MRLRRVGAVGDLCRSKTPPHSPHPPAALAPGIATLPGATLPPQKNQRSEATPAAINEGEIFLTIPDKLFPTLTNSEQLTDFSMTPAEPLFMRSAKVKAGEKKESG